MGDSQFAVGVKVVIDVEQERSRIGNIPQAGTGTSDVPSMMGFSGTFAQGLREKDLTRLINDAVSRAEERLEREPRERISGSATMISGKLDLPSSQTMEEHSKKVRDKGRTSIKELLSDPIESIADLSGGIPIAGAYIAPSIRAGHRFTQARASGEMAFLEGAVKGVLEEATKDAPDFIKKSIKRMGAENLLTLAVPASALVTKEVATAIESANMAVSPTKDRVFQFVQGMSAMGMGKQATDIGTVMDFMKGTFEMEYYNAKFGLKRKQWQGTWAGEAVGRGLYDICRQAMAR